MPRVHLSDYRPEGKLPASTNAGNSFRLKRLGGSKLPVNVRF
jgi:hypothetical protein